MKKMKRFVCLMLAGTMLMTSNVTAFATEVTGAETTNETGADATSLDGTVTTPDTTTTGTGTTDAGTTGANGAGTTGSGTAGAGSTDANGTGTTGSGTGTNTTDTTGAGSTGTGTTDANGTGTTGAGSTDTNTTGTTTESSETTETKETENITGAILVDENNDDVEIKEDDRPYLALGADLSEAQRNTVLSLMGIDPANLANYDVVYITNAEEHQYLDSYVDTSKIGSKSLSSVVIMEREKGNGLNISTNNISYCTVGMYKNALTTAGITDADIIVVGPSTISGTAALVGIFKAYEEMTGVAIDGKIVDAALNELVITGELEETIEGLTNEEVEEFVAYIKSLIAENGMTDEASINDAIDQACEKYGVTLSDDERQKIVDLLLKITALGIDLSGLVDYAASLYNSFKNGGSSNGGIFGSIGSFFTNVFSAISDFFKNLFS